MVTENKDIALLRGKNVFTSKHWLLAPSESTK